MKRFKYLKQSFGVVYRNGKVYFWLYIISNLLTASRVYISAWLSKQLINGLLDGLNTHEIDKKLIIWAVLIVINDILYNGVNIIVSAFSEISLSKYNDYLSVECAQKQSRMKFEMFDNPVMQNTIKQFILDSQGMLNTFCQFVTLLISLASFVVSLIISLRFSVLVTLVSLMIALPSFFIRKKNRESDYTLEKELNLTSRIIEYFFNINTNRENYKEIHLYGARPFFFDLLKQRLKERLDKRILYKKAKMCREAILLIVFSVANFIVNLYIVLFVVMKNLTIGDYTYYLSIINNFKNNTDTIVTSINEIIISLKKAENYYDVLNSKNNEYKIGEREVCQEITEIHFLNVSFKYPSSEQYILKDLSFKIRKDEKIALAGLNGAGKTTIINLLLRFYEPTAGKILINGIDIKEYNLYDYWKYFSCMFQNSMLYNVSLKENILLGKHNKSIPNDEECILKAADKIGLSISSDYLLFPVNKQFFQDGLVFSPGQIQKLNILRTIIKEASIIIFDEPSSALDAATEDIIFNELLSASENKTMILISHRLSCLKDVDRIIFLENGQIVEEGNHMELIQNHGRYYELFTKQSQKYC